MTNPQNVSVNVDTSKLRSELASLGGVISAAFKDAVEEALDPEKFRFVAKDITTLARQSSKFSDKLVENELKLKQGILNRKTVETQIIQTKVRQQALNELLNKAQEMGVQLCEEARKAIEETKKYQEAQVSILAKQEEKLKLIEKRTGLLGVMFKGMAKIPLVGELIRAEEALEAMRGTASETGNKFKILTAGLKEATKNASTLMLVAVGKALVDRFKVVDTATENVARSLNMSYQASKGLMSNYIRIADASRNTFITSDKLAKTVTDLSDELGVAVELDEERLSFATKLREQGKFSVETVNTLTKLTLMRGENEKTILEDANKQITAVRLQTGINLNNRKVLESIGKVSSAIKVNFGGSVTALAKGVAQTKALGLELDKVDNLASSLLDFESSIQSQMEAELLIGRALNVDKARYQALTNDTVGLAKTIAQDLGTAAEYGKMNRIQQESIAKAYGMSREEVSQMLLDQEIMAKTGGETFKTLQKQYAEQVKLGKEEEFLNELGKKGLRDQFEQNSLQVRQQAIQEKLAASMDKIAAALTPIAEMFVKIGETIAKYPELIRAATTALLLYKAASMFGKGSIFSSGGAAGGGVPSMLQGKLSVAGQIGQVTPPAGSISVPGVTGSGPVAPPSAAKGGGFFSKMGGFFKSLNPKELWKSIGGAKGFISRALKIGGISTLIEGFMANADIKGIIGSGGSTDTIAGEIGKRVAEGIGSITGGAALGALLSPIPGGTLLGGFLGASAGKWIADKLVGEDGAPGLGRAVGNALYGKELKEAGIEELATGGIVTTTGLAKVDRGEVYLGANSITVLRDMLNALTEQNRYLAALVAKDQTITIDGQKLANVVARNIPTSYGNILNPSTRTYG